MTDAGRQEVTLLALLLIGISIAAAVSDRPRVSPATEQTRFTEFEPWVIDVNSSDWVQLSMIDGVGVTTAKRIAAARESGPFTDPDDLAGRVRGISPAAAARMWIVTPVVDD